MCHVYTYCATQHSTSYHHDTIFISSAVTVLYALTCYYYLCDQPHEAHYSTTNVMRHAVVATAVAAVAIVAATVEMTVAVAVAAVSLLA
jgi:hypothetical protein